MPNHPSVIMLSCWRNDVQRQLAQRAQHLLAKSYPNLRWVWVVGDSQDQTAEELRYEMFCHNRNVTLVDIGDTGLTERMRRFGTAAQAGLDRVLPEDDYVLVHESDLVSPPDIVERLLAPGHDVLGGWTVLGSAPLLYDIWGIRGLDGAHFHGLPPYHHDYRPDAPFEVSSVGSCWLLPAAAVRDGIRCDTFGAVELCRGLRERGYRIWCDPRIEIVQPLALWTSREFPPEVAHAV